MAFGKDKENKLQKKEDKKQKKADAKKDKDYTCPICGRDAKGLKGVAVSDGRICGMCYLLSGVKNKKAPIAIG